MRKFYLLFAALFAYTVVANTEQQMVQEVKDALRDGFLALVAKTQNKGE